MVNRIQNLGDDFKMDLIENLLHSLLEVIFVLLNPLILIPAVILLIVFIKKHKEY